MPRETENIAPRAAERQASRSEKSQTPKGKEEENEYGREEKVDDKEDHWDEGRESAEYAYEYVPVVQRRKGRENM
jgi:hypothetical protein